MYTEAADSYERALRGRSREYYARVYYNRSVLYRKMGLYDQAEDDLVKATNALSNIKNNSLRDAEEHTIEKLKGILNFCRGEYGHAITSLKTSSVYQRQGLEWVEDKEILYYLLLSYKQQQMNSQAEIFEKRYYNTPEPVDIFEVKEREADLLGARIGIGCKLDP
jgi:tetratricopeptide (TPR) repeat protein